MIPAGVELLSWGGGPGRHDNYIDLKIPHEGKVETLWMIRVDNMFTLADVKRGVAWRSKYRLPPMRQREWMSIVHRCFRKERAEQIARFGIESFGEPYEVNKEATTMEGASNDR
jgi:hypothetical protein